MTLPLVWTTSGPVGNLWDATFQFLNDDDTPMDITTKTFQLVLRTTTRKPGTPAAVINSSGATSQGYITVTTATSTVLCVLTPAATAALTPGSVYDLALIMNPDLPDQEAMVRGLFTASPIAAAA